MRELGRTLLVFGGVAVMAGAFLFFGGRLPLRLGDCLEMLCIAGNTVLFIFRL